VPGIIGYMLQLNLFNLGEGFDLLVFGDVWQGLSGWWWCDFISRSWETLANSPWWHRKGGFSSLKHGVRQMLGFKSEGLNPEHRKINAKVNDANVWEQDKWIQ
jgi:hypothetical protein